MAVQVPVSPDGDFYQETSTTTTTTTVYSSSTEESALWLGYAQFDASRERVGEGKKLWITLAIKNSCAWGG